MDGKPSPPSPSISQLTSRFDQITSNRRRPAAQIPTRAGGGVGGVGGQRVEVIRRVPRTEEASFDNPANISPSARARSGCLGAVAGVPSSGAPWPVPPRSRTDPAPTSEPAIEGGTRPTGRPADVTGLHERIQRSEGGSFRPLIPSARREASEGEEMTERPSVQSKNRMSPT